jgi:hypothetical protein
VAVLEGDPPRHLLEFNRYEAIHMIRKGQACWSAAGGKVGLLHRFILGLFATTS